MMDEEKQMTVQQMVDTIQMLKSVGATGAWKTADQAAIKMLRLELKLVKITMVCNELIQLSSSGSESKVNVPKKKLNKN